MPNAIKTLLRGRLARTFTLIMMIGATLFVLVPEAALIEGLNLIAISFSLSVVIAYSPVAWVALNEENPSRAHVLVFGIFLTHTAVLISRFISFSRRSLGMNGVADSDLVSLFVLLAIMGALCHLNAPEVVDGTVPTKQWVRIGLIVGAGAFLITGSVAYQTFR
ncbi:MAG: hypothetical protein O9972_13015 [Burkholderiales bacterium]|nr:hypothetical protein [Burkholderiales bacterium]